MAKRVVQVELSPAQELALLDRYGRKCSPEGAVKRAIAEILKQQEEDVPVFRGLITNHSSTTSSTTDQPLYPYCVTCKERCAVSHSDDNQAGIDEFLRLHPSPDHEVNPLWQGEVPSASN